MPRFLALLFVSLLVACAQEGDRDGECFDHADNDQDGSFDCDDPDCSSTPQCEQAAVKAAEKEAAENTRLAQMDWVSIPGGDFEMIRSEVTVAQYRACVDEKVCTPPTECGYGEPNWGQSERDDHPVNCVTWDMASTFAKWAGGRLPTESEWEHAAKGGESFEYAGSDNVDEVAWHGGNSNNRTHAVCEKKRNGYGLCDMSGNMFEWTSTADGSNRVTRGGTCFAHASFALVGSRNEIDQGSRGYGVGFRVVR